MEQEPFDLLVVGAGIVGLATAYQYQKQNPGHRIAILEKEADLARHQTGRNSGVIHSGIYYQPGSYKARLCVAGRKQMVQFAREHGVKHEVCGKIILATKEAERPLLHRIYQRGQENGIEGIHLIGPEEIKEIEPYAAGPEAIRVPVTGIVDYVGFCRALLEAIQALNSQSKIYFNQPITGIGEVSGAKVLYSESRAYRGKKAVFCAGLQADRLARMDGAKPAVRIVGFRGDYYELSESGKSKVKHLIYPVPDPNFPFLGVHFTRMTDGSVECGPNAVFSFKREGYHKTAFDWHDTLEALSFAGTWRLFLRHPAKGIDEYKRAFSKKLFLRALQGLIPSLQMEDIQPVRSGVRAQAIQADGTLVDDFQFSRRKYSVHVINAPSPAATACLAIGEEIIKELSQLEQAQ